MGTCHPHEVFTLLLSLWHRIWNKQRSQLKLLKALETAAVAKSSMAVHLQNACLVLLSQFWTINTHYFASQHRCKVLCIVPSSIYLHG